MGNIFPEKVYQMYRDQLSEVYELTLKSVDDLENISSEDVLGIAKFAHKVAGSAGLFGDINIENSCRQVDRFVKENDGEIDGKLEEVKPLLSELITTLNMSDYLDV